jgi:hypothetical protein
MDCSAVSLPLKLKTTFACFFSQSHHLVNDGLDCSAVSLPLKLRSCSCHSRTSPPPPITAARNAQKAARQAPNSPPITAASHAPPRFLTLQSCPPIPAAISALRQLLPKSSPSRYMPCAASPPVLQISTAISASPIGGAQHRPRPHRLAPIHPRIGKNTISAVRISPTPRPPSTSPNGVPSWNYKSEGRPHTRTPSGHTRVHPTPTISVDYEFIMRNLSLCSLCCSFCYTCDFRKSLQEPTSQSTTGSSCTPGAPSSHRGMFYKICVPPWYGFYTFVELILHGKDLLLRLTPETDNNFTR